MSKQVQKRRGTSSEHASFTGAVAEITVDTETNELVLGDGVTQGGRRVGISRVTTSDLINSVVKYPQDDVIKTCGFTTPGDAGGGKWKQNGVTGQTPSQTPAQLGDALLNDANGNQWQLLDSEQITAKQFGAIGDGIHDDKLAMTAFFSCVCGKPVKGYICSGVYIISTTLAWDLTGDFCVELHPQATIKASSSLPVDAKLIHPNKQDTGDFRFELTGGKFDGREMPARSTGAPSLIYLNSKSLKKVKIKDAYFITNDDRTGTAGDECIFLAEGEDYEVTGCYFQGSIDSAIYISGDSSESFGRRAIITNNTFTETLNAIASKRQFEDHVISGNIIENTGIAILMGGEADSFRLPGKKSIIANNVIKNVSRGIEVRVNDGCVVTGNRVENYGQNSSGVTVFDYGIRLSGSSNCLVSNNVLIINEMIVPIAAAIACQKYSYNGVDYISKENLIATNVVKNTSTAFSEGSDSGENLWVQNSVQDYNNLLSLQLTGGSRAIQFDKDGRLINSFGESGAGPTTVTDVFYENDGALNIQYCVPSASSVSWFVGDETNNAVARWLYDNNTDTWSWRAGGSGNIFNIDKNGPRMPSFTVASLPISNIQDGTQVYVSDGVKAGEGVGSGTGVMAFYDGSNWIACDTGLTVSA